ncbi:prevent-host-death protein [Streptomyces sp. NPDC001478]
MHDQGPRFLGTLMQLADGQLIVISKAGLPLARPLTSRPQVRRPGRGSLRGRIRIADNFDDEPASVAAALGMR